MLIIISDPHSFATSCSARLFVITLGLLLLRADAVVTMKHVHCLVQAHPVLDENLPLSHLSHIQVCIVRFCFVANCCNNSMLSLMCAMICWEKMKTPVRKSRLM